MELFTFNQLLADPVFQHFYQICQIPHGSKNEEALAKFILSWAQEHSMKAEIDKIGNVLIKKMSLRKDIPTVVLQAHLDMVCVKSAHSSHNFSRDPIPWVICGDTLGTGKETSLGADDGIGVALALSMLELDSSNLPNLEVLLTVSEEDDMSGALSFDTSKLDADLLINLDHTNENEIMCGSCGGMRVDFNLPVQRISIPEEWKCAHLALSGLTGGHSGEDIHRGRGNAAVLLARILDQISRQCEYGICSLQGGSMRLSIPTEAEAFLCFPSASGEIIQQIVRSASTEIKREFSLSGPHLEVLLQPCSVYGDGTYSTPSSVLPAILLLPDGIYQMSESIPGMVDTSDNLGEVYLKGNALEIVLELRSLTDSLRFHLYRKIELLAQMMGAACSYSEEYPGWTYNPSSELTALAVSVYREIYGKDPKLLTLHAGLEPGCLIQSRPSLDAISIGPNLWNLHSVNEEVSISSVQRFYSYLQYILTAICAKGSRHSGETD